MNNFGKATVKMEGGIADPDEFTWGCNCADCQEKYETWKEKFNAQQKQLRGEVNEAPPQ